MPNRRDWMLSMCSLAAACALSACASSPSGTAQNAGFARRKIGQAQVIALSDGITRRMLDAGFVKNAPLPAVQAALAAAGLPTTHIDVPYTCFVVELDGQRYLLDAGFADNGGQGTGLLHTHMQAAGIDPASINHVIISHMHGDHIQGLRRKDGSLVYPKATVHVPQPEANFWFDNARMLAMPEASRGGFMTVRRVFKDYPQAQLRTFTPGAAIAPGLGTMAAFGHSPGHTAIAVHSGNARFVYIGDAAHYPALFVRHPDWQVQFDMNPEMARQSRHALLQQLAREQSWVGGYHFPMPAMGRIKAIQGGFDWKP